MLTLSVQNEGRVVLITEDGTEISVYAKVIKGRCKLSIDAPQKVRILRDKFYMKEFNANSV